MQVAKEVEAEIKAARKIWLPRWGVLCIIICTLPIYWLFDHFGRLNLALPTLICIGMLGLALTVKWKLRRRLWFWITMAVFAALHVLLIFSVPWTIKWVPALAIAAIGSADLIAMVAILSVVEKFMQKPETP